MRFGRFILQQLQFALSSFLALGLVAGLLVLLTGGIEGTVTADIDLGYSDIIWLLLGIPVGVMSLFLVVSPLAFLIHKAVSRTSRG